MALDPRTPVVVGVGQATVDPDPDTEPAGRPEPLDLMVRALRAAAEDCDGVAAGAAAAAGERDPPGGQRLGGAAAGLAHHQPGPARGRAPGLHRRRHAAELMLSAIGGNTPQAMMHDACRAIAPADLDVVLVTGAEALYTRAASRTRPGHAHPGLGQPGRRGHARPTVFGSDRPGATELEMSRGVLLPIHAYPLFENALRAANGWTLAEHAAHIGALWSRFSQVAATNPNAWIRSPRTAEEIALPSPDNRMISFPYPKLCTANMQVDQGAGYIVCSVEAARAPGCPRTAGSSRCRAPTPTTTGTSRTGTRWTALPPFAWPARRPWTGRSGHRRRRPRRPLFLLSRRCADGGPRAGAPR